MSEDSQAGSGEIRTIDCEVCGDVIGMYDNDAYIVIDMKKCRKCHKKVFIGDEA